MKKNHILRAATILLILLLFSTSIVTGRLARYVSTESSGDSARVAKFELNHTGIQENVFYTHIKPGEVTVHTITVVNSSEVAMRYSVQLVNESNNLPGLKFLMTGKKTGDILTGNYDSVTMTFSDELPPDSSEVTIYVQTTWDNTSSKNTEKVDYVRILVTAEQID